ncbi:F-box protein [Streptomyces sp. NPDC057910]|uniref:F-box protein n=1 Tax=Streptomyces sp. NPDC057910 TaxID=3346278 RepID=UPI0036F0AA4A
MTTRPENGTGLNAQAQEVWAIVAPALQDSNGEPGLPARAHQALQTWPTHNLPHDLWQEILALLPLEDQTRLAHTSHPIQDILEQLAPQALDPTAHTTPGFTRTIYTQTELDHSLNTGKWVEFVPGTDSNLTIRQGLAEVHGPGTLTAITGGTVTALDDTHITTVAGGNITAEDQTMITTVTGGTIRAHAQASIEEVTGGNVYALEQATITTVTDGKVYARLDATIATVNGGNVWAHGQATIGTVTGGAVTADGNTTVTAVRGDAYIVACGNARVTIETSASDVRVDAYDAAHITAHSGTITIHSPDVTITSDSGGHAVINHA